ncbi:Ig-like domain-containing protein, partial [Treponema sp.]|uniref:Ig-like domain-containing protein n=1 Tax=Treponema sp. TaxID=166 RepID=UPI00298D8C6A
MRKSFYFIAIFSLFAFFTGCEVGMGQALDLEAPVITVTSPETLSNVHKQFTITGTCSDNIAVTAVEISDKQTGEIYAKAIINGSNWVANLNIAEGEKTLVCTAKDAAGNGSTKSSKTMIYLVDETAPEGLSWYVDRGNNVQTPLMELEKLQNLDYDDFTNIDVPQNQSFKIYGRFYDAMSIKTITLKLYEGTTLVSEKSVSATTIAAGSSIYSPCFEFSASDMALCTGTGKHYLKLKYESEDDHGNITNGERGELNYMLWWPDSDEPRIEYKGLKNGMLRVNIGSAIPIHFFDDDLLEEVRYALVDSVGTEEAV